MERKLETRKTEERFVTSDLSKMFGKYIAKHVVKKWTEDFFDEDTGEVVSIERNEVLIPAGTYIDHKIQTEINFFMQSAGVEEVEVSNQSRLGRESKLGYMGTWFAVIDVASKKHKIVLHATSIDAAIEVLKDFAELNYAGHFKILQLKTFDNCVTLTDNLVKLELTDDGIQEEEEEDKLNKKFYKITMNIEQDGVQYPMLFIVHGKDVENSTALIENYVNQTAKERAEAEGVEMPVLGFSLESAAPIPCSAIIEKDFCLAYKEE